MSTFEDLIYRGLNFSLEEKIPLYGMFHMITIILTIVLTVCMVMFFRNAKDSTMRTLVFIGWIIMILFEIGKQVTWTLQSDGTWVYHWHVFPFQFCSTPMYTFPFVFLLKDCKFRKAIMAFIATFSLFAGLIVMILPTTVLTQRVFTSTQSMIHHGLQIVFGVYMAAYNRRHLNKRFFAWCMMVFGAFASVALALNLTIYPALQAKNPDEVIKFCMFYISPYDMDNLPILYSIWQKVNFPVYLIIYIFGFTLVAALVYAIEKGIVALTLRKEKRVQNQHQPQE